MTAFIIDKDHYAEQNQGTIPGLRSSAGITGPASASDRDVERLKAGEGTAFRLLDDDGELYFTGRRLEESDADVDYFGENELAPLDCFGMPDSGCTMQQERNADGKWESLT